MKTRGESEQKQFNLFLCVSCVRMRSRVTRLSRRSLCVCTVKNENIKLLEWIKRAGTENDIVRFICNNDVQSGGVVELTVTNSFGTDRVTVTLNVDNITMPQ